MSGLDFPFFPAHICIYCKGRDRAIELYPYVVCSGKTAILQISVANKSVIVLVHNAPHIPFLIISTLPELLSGPLISRTFITEKNRNETVTGCGLC